LIEKARHDLELFVEKHDLSFASLDDRTQVSLLDPALS
jgi:hypothetical protein